VVNWHGFRREWGNGTGKVFVTVTEPSVGQHAEPFLEGNRQLVEVLGEIDTGPGIVWTGASYRVRGIRHLWLLKTSPGAR
jgi:hypothetical protein